MLSTVYDLYHFNALLLSAAVSYLLYKGILRHSNLKPDNYKENAMEHRGYRNGELMLVNFDLSNANSNVLSTSNDIISDLGQEIGQAAATLGCLTKLIWHQNEDDFFVR
jgi:hypothetical protein